MSRTGQAPAVAASPPLANIHAVKTLRALVLAVCSLCLALPAVCAAEPGFDLLELQVEGNTVLPAAAIEAAVEPHLGPGRGMAGVEAARAALEAAYQKAGYLTVLVDVPEQKVDGGTVRLAVLEGRVGGLYVLGSRYHDQGWIRAKVSALQAGGVPNFNEVQAQLAEVNRDSRRVQPVLKPGKLPGTVDVELQVEDRLPLSGSVEFHNQHSAGTEPLRMQASLRYDNLFQRDHSLGLTVITAPGQPRQSLVGVANYLMAEASGDSWNVSLTLSDSDVETLGGTQVLGRGATLGLRRAQVFGRRGADRTAVLTWGADLKLLRERTVFGEAGFSTPLRYLPFQLAYSDASHAAAERWQWNASLTAAWRELLQRDVDCPLASGGSGPQDQFACKRKGGDGSFLVGKLDLRTQWRLGEPAAGGSTPDAPGAGGWGWLHARLGAQVASGPLVSSEQYAIGGADTVRGYRESEATGDRGLIGSLEWRPPNQANAGTPGLRELYPLVFAEAGRVFTLDAAAGQAPAQSLASFGLGLRFVALGEGATTAEGGLDLGFPLRATGNSRVGDPYVHARLATRF